MIRIMLDSNIIISGIVFSGNERKLLNNIYSKGLILILNDYIVIEVESVMQKKFPKHKLIFQTLIDQLIVEFNPIPSIDMIDRAKLIIRDPKDAVILASAIDAKLDYFVSGDLDFHTNDVCAQVNVVNTIRAIDLIGQYLMNE
jgi:putative PIN family toxin of toxin-antitoxin system